MGKNLKGTFLVVLAAIAWGISGVSGQSLMAKGIDVHLLTALRLIIAGLVLVGLAAVQNFSKLLAVIRDKSSCLGIMLFSLLGLTLNQYSYLQAISQTNAGTATVLQYMAPVLILAFLCFKDRLLPNLSELIAILLAILGTFVMATHGQVGSLAITPLGLFWGLFSAITYSAYILLPVRLIKQWGSLLVIGLGMLMGGLVFGVTMAVWRFDPQFSRETVWSYLGLIVVGSILSYTLFLKGSVIVGAVKASLLASIEPIAAVVFSVLLVKEHFYLVDMIGMLLIFLAVLLISLKDLRGLRKQTKRADH